MNIKTSIIQFKPHFGEIERNLSEIDRLTNNTTSSKVVVLPELANSGYNFSSKEEAYALSELPEESKLVSMLTEKALKHDQLFVCGVNERAGNDIYNTALLISGKGIITKYRKIHLFMNEKDHFLPGDLGFVVHDTGTFRIGLLICFDWIFPEAWRILALKGADLVCIPSNLVLPYAQQAVPVQALMNRYFIMLANRIGTEKELTFTGGSLIAGPDSTVLAKAEKESEQVISAELDISLARNKMVTDRNHVIDDRRPELYGGLCE